MFNRQKCASAVIIVLIFPVQQLREIALFPYKLLPSGFNFTLAPLHSMPILKDYQTGWTDLYGTNLMLSSNFLLESTHVRK